MILWGFLSCDSLVVRWLQNETHHDCADVSRYFSLFLCSFTPQASHFAWELVELYPAYINLSTALHIQHQTLYIQHQTLKNTINVPIIWLLGFCLFAIVVNDTFMKQD